MLAACSVVAIHGLGGGPVATWTEPETKTFWLKDFLPTNLSSARIMTFGYNADAAFSSTLGDIDAHATDLLVNVVDKREGSDVSCSIMYLGSPLLKVLLQEQQRPIIFVAHSLGGIIVKQVSGISLTSVVWLCLHLRPLGSSQCCGKRIYR